MVLSIQHWLNHIQEIVSDKPALHVTGNRRIDGWIEHFSVGSQDAFQQLRNSNPLNVFLSLIVAYLFISLLKPYSIAKLTPTLAQARSTKKNQNNAYSFLPDQHPPTTVWTKYTPRTLAVHDGSELYSKTKRSSNDQQGGRILLAIQGKVFDVTKGANFYGPGGPYGNFAGRDASRGMAKQSFDLEMLTPLDKPIDSLEDLTPMEVNNMREWVSHFSAKYTIVGELVNEGEEGDD
ncbi:hypothetical protein L7F22_054045 [Adiantum nelumboides]|nr:hypothetical protein [Adiantum nelumboides]